MSTDKPRTELRITQAIRHERERRLALKASGRPFHYWRERGDNEPPREEHWCDHCAGYYGVPHDFQTHEGEFCSSMGMPSMSCAEIDCAVFRTLRGQAYELVPVADVPPVPRRRRRRG